MSLSQICGAFFIQPKTPTSKPQPVRHEDLERTLQIEDDFFDGKITYDEMEDGIRNRPSTHSRVPQISARPR